MNPIDSLDDNPLLDLQTSAYFVAGCALTLAVQQIWNCLQPRRNETYLEKTGRLLATHIPEVKGKVNEEVRSNYLSFLKNRDERFKKFGTPITQIPKYGWDPLNVIKLLHYYEGKVLEGLEGKEFSGMIYSSSLKKSKKETPELDTSFFTHQGKRSKKKPEELTEEELADYVNEKSEVLKYVFKEGFGASYLWNSLHTKDFAIGQFITYQVVRMVAGLFGADAKDVMGVLTSGGTGSLMHIARCYQEWGMAKKGLDHQDCVIIAPDTIHAAVEKASMAHHFTLIKVSTNDAGHVDLKDLEKAMKKHKKQLVAVFASAPNYPTGVVDDLKGVARLVQKYECGMHVDCCLGGGVVNYLDDTLSEILNTPGVTSLSCDNHKNLLAPKGVSTLIGKELDEINILFHGIYAILGWKGGVYGTPKNEGSERVPANALLSLLILGEYGLRAIAFGIQRLIKNVVEGIEGESLKGRIRIVAEPEVNVLAFSVDPSLNLKSNTTKSATYGLAEILDKKGFHVSGLDEGKLHVCFTSRHLGNPNMASQFLKLLEESVDELERLDEEGHVFEGDAKLYSNIEATLKPKVSKLGLKECALNSLLGRQTLEKIVKAFFLSEMSTMMA